MKVTPSHSAIDYQWHKIMVSTSSVSRTIGNIQSADLCHNFNIGMAQIDLRPKVWCETLWSILDDIEELNLIKTLCRLVPEAGDVIEGNLLPQWFIRMSRVVPNYEKLWTEMKSK